MMKFKTYQTSRYIYMDGSASRVNQSLLENNQKKIPESSKKQFNLPGSKNYLYSIFSQMFYLLDTQHVGS